MPEPIASTVRSQRVEGELTNSGVGHALIFRFVIASVSITAIGVAQIELERRRLLVERDRVECAEATAEVRHKLGQLRIALAKQSAPSALLERIDGPVEAPAEPQDAVDSDNSSKPTRSANARFDASERPQ